VGDANGIDLAGLGVVLGLRYSDDEERSPWTFRLFIDDRADAPQHDALGNIFRGAFGGAVFDHFPWVWKPSNLVSIEPARIELDHTPGRGWIRAGRSVSIRVSRGYEGPETVTCVIPGHTREGRELVVDELKVDSGPLGFEYQGVCGYESTFDYSS
jgi:hypothetical protein